MKKCNKCQQVKPLNEFNKHAARKDGLQSFCRKCSKTHYKNYYKNNPAEKERLLKSNKRVNKDKLEWLRGLKNLPCADCKNIFPPYVMDFDHLGDKEFGIANFCYRYGKKKLLAEIAKCEVVCANCHRIRTYERQCQVTLSAGVTRL